MNTTQLKEFFASRPSLSKRGVCREAGISDTLLDSIMLRGGKLTDRVSDKLTPVLNRYGGCFGSYELLNDGEIITENDEWLKNANEWVSVEYYNIGKVFINRVYYPYRRKV